ncbi:MAG: hypothetical protein V4613_04390 [Bacteroidota bacterium]
MINYFKNSIPFTIVLIALAACSFIPASEENQTKNEQVFYHAIPYDSLTIPDFFTALTARHLPHFYLIDSNRYLDFCKDYEINSKDTTNLKTYFTIEILHQLFTSETASNFSKGPILNIPYLWHWTKPNPRHSIYMAATGKLLKDLPPPAEFSKYKSYADIDRTPYFYLSDLVAERTKYRSSDFDTFATFGWCSEREMAFVALMQLLHFEGLVIVSGNHSWSEFNVSYRLTSGLSTNFTATVDNTFNRINYDPHVTKSIRSSNWYNQTAHSNKEISKIQKHWVPQLAMNRIEQQVIQFLNNKK